MLLNPSAPQAALNTRFYPPLSSSQRLLSFSLSNAKTLRYSLLLLSLGLFSVSTMICCRGNTRWVRQHAELKRSLRSIFYSTTGLISSRTLIISERTPTPECAPKHRQNHVPPLAPGIFYLSHEVRDEINLF